MWSRCKMAPVDEQQRAGQEKLERGLAELDRKMESRRQELDNLRTAAVAGSSERHRTAEELREMWDEWQHVWGELQKQRGQGF